MSEISHGFGKVFFVPFIYWCSCFMHCQSQHWPPLLNVACWTAVEYFWLRFLTFASSRCIYSIRTFFASCIVGAVHSTSIFANRIVLSNLENQNISADGPICLPVVDAHQWILYSRRFSRWLLIKFGRLSADVFVILSVQSFLWGLHVIVLYFNNKLQWITK